MTPRLLVDAQAALGECALWCERTNALWWTDILGATLHRWQERDGSVQAWPMPQPVGSFALCDGDARLLLGLASGIGLFDPADGRVSDIQPFTPDAPGMRINDGRCDRQGRFVFGQFHRPETPVGHFWRVDASLRIERLPLPPAGVANSIAFSPDGATMYFADSPKRTIFSVDYGADGSLGEPRVFVRLRADDGFPDGSTVDADGGLWNAQWDGGCIVRYDSAGRESTRIALPVSRPTCPAFGGARLQDLFVTSARAGLAPDALVRGPAAGGVLALETAWRGLPEARFVLVR